MQAREVMTHPVITVRADTPIDQAAQLLVRHGFTALPVTNDDDRLVGIVTEADLLGGRIGPDPRSHPHQFRDSNAAPPLTVAGVMSTPVESLTPGADAADAARAMVEERIRCLPIVDGARIVGVITRRDLLRAGVWHNDKDLAAEISRQLAAFSGPDRWAVSVQAGVADIEDHADSAEDRIVAETLTAAVPGVVHAQARYLTSESS